MFQVELPFLVLMHKFNHDKDSFTIWHKKDTYSSNHYYYHHLHIIIIWSLWNFSALGIEVVRCDWKEMDFTNRDISGILIQYPDTDGHVHDYMELVDNAHANGVSTPSWSQSVHNDFLFFYVVLHNIASYIFSRPLWPVQLTF